MTRVDFYKLSGSNASSVNRFCCQLADKAVREGHRVYIQTDTMNEARFLDDLMWTWNDQSFLPHTLDRENDPEAPVIISHRPAGNDASLLINLAAELPTRHDTFERIAEVINDDANRLDTGRRHYASYKSLDCDLHYHELNR